ncbi:MULTISPECIES: DNA polymerase III subunit gamma/tau [unclassified Thermosynechococcus]|uniref:DNA polymerase III subunit gamma/tau n=1 Tax=unclassified Thermosynechococcus TaxID=2622553 RepID=UPI00267204F0|nr:MULTISPECIES: DNA polymerase III subunit gamma/tau [unclassified Thermosynechococcus]MDR5640243.1 DNA polymerase III subunit gamma/tau [Thermosynechococcus sp. PP42]MDR7923033.1 DNA polymerase III subunit gamma/tau [Thermosynechococcus sp. HY213]WKT81152.1 DNA polymerase III subunit gamma/tau [Thermosynechococcus sp. PP45]WNC24763.1 DNA polymerase III subunit gamma/tau [Thermosynechococcus sp. PP551]WNC27340.1 DNA polymerase III subunit gamma/tau [Thermosynechococcus sp. PP555]
MTYEPLHHKYRPQRFADLVGQGAIATTLTQALLKERIAPAYLFCGPRGTGKTSSARILAKSLNCLRSAKPTPDPCGQCEVCRQVANGNSLDVIEIDAASHTGVDNIRELIEKAQFAPVQCRYKVYVIDECHMLSVSAFNALLKTLEEPPPHVVFVLATTDPQRVLPTIISRCQRFDFRRIPLGEMVAHLQHIADKEQIDIEPQALTLVAQLSQGGLRDAESLLDQLSLYPERITVEHVWQLAGAVPEQDLRQLLGAIARRDAVAVLEHTRQLLERGRDPLTILQNLASLYRDLLLAKTVPERQDLVALTAETWQALIAVAEGWSVEEILHAQQHLRTCESQIKQSSQPRLWLEISILGLMTETAPQSSVPNVAPTAIPKLTIVSPPQPDPPGIAAPPKESESPVKHIQIKDTKDTVAPAPEPKPTPEPRADHTEPVWEQALQVLQQMQMSTYALLSQHGHLRQMSDREVHIGIVNQTLLNLTKNNQAKIEAAFAQVLGRRIKVAFEIAPLPHKTTPAPKAKEPPHSAVVVPFQPREEPPPPPIEPTSTPPPPPLTTAPDPVRESAEKLARFFNGVVIRLPDEGESPDTPIAEASEEDELEF